MIRALLYDPSTNVTHQGDESLLEDWQKQPDSCIWIDLEGEDNDVERDLLGRHFNADPLALADAQRSRHPPKLEIFDDHFFMLLRGLNTQSDGLEFTTMQIALFVGARFVVTRRAVFSPSVANTWDAVIDGQVELANGPAHITYLIARQVADRYTKMVSRIETRLDELEDEMFRDPRDVLLNELMNYSANLKKLRRIFTYQQALMAELATERIPFFKKRTKHEFNDVYEHMERLASLSGLYEELAADLVNGYISLNSHRLNQIMKVLTIFTVIFLPLSLLAGIYGMNFEVIPELHWRYGYFVVIGTMGVIALALLWAFRRLKWL
jgi:magnesium transporter